MGLPRWGNYEQMCSFSLVSPGCPLPSEGLTASDHPGQTCLVSKEKKKKTLTGPAWSILEMLFIERCGVSDVASISGSNSLWVKKVRGALGSHEQRGCKNKSNRSPVLLADMPPFSKNPQHWKSETPLFWLQSCRGVLMQPFPPSPFLKSKRDSTVGRVPALHAANPD